MADGQYPGLTEGVWEKWMQAKRERDEARALARTLYLMLDNDEIDGEYAPERWPWLKEKVDGQEEH